jgi:hypothetical protein
MTMTLWESPSVKDEYISLNTEKYLCLIPVIKLNPINNWWPKKYRFGYHIRYSKILHLLN